MTHGSPNHLPADALARFGLTLLRHPRTTTDLKIPENAAAFIRHNVLAGRHAGPLLGGLFVDDELRPLGYTLPYLGYLADADVEPRNLLTPALLAPAAALFLFRQRPGSRLEASGSSEVEEAVPLSPERAAMRRRWANLIRRVYEVDPLVCPC